MRVGLVVVWYNRENEGPDNANQIAREIAESGLVNEKRIVVGNGAAIPLAHHHSLINNRSNVVVIFPPHIGIEEKKEIIAECFTDVDCNLHLYAYSEFKIEVLKEYVNPEVVIS